MFDRKQPTFDNHFTEAGNTKKPWSALHWPYFERLIAGIFSH